MIPLQAGSLARRAVRPALAALILYLCLIQPNHPAAMTWAALLAFPLELPATLLGLCLVSRSGWARAVCGGLVTALTVIALLKVADYVMFTTLGRGFNPIADLPLLEAGLRLTTGAIGLIPTIAAVLAALGAVIGLVWALWWASGVWARIVPPSRMMRALAGAAILFAGIAVAEIGDALGRWTLPVSPPGAAFTARVGVERVETAFQTLADLRDFRQAARKDDFAGRTDLLGRLDRDVLIVFVESYGRASHDIPFYAETHRATLAKAEDRLRALGLSMRSGFLDAPTRGGQSWLSHATFANGLWIADQTSYGAALASGRQSLFHIAANAGFRTAAVMPQITLDWPESERMGFETVLAADALGYAGLPFNWVTMPDQFTLAALDRLLRDGTDPRPLFVQVALASSHAPWVPVPSLLAWDDIGDGRVFNDMALSGDPPDVVWRDRERVRKQYRRAVDYSLSVVFAYIARHAADPPLIFIVGDHQAANFVALDERADVPVHLIGPEDLVSAADSWGWAESLLPGQDVAVRSMAEMRDLILDAYSDPTTLEGRS